MKRVMIIGQPGSGKSTLARRLGEKLNLPVIHMDKIHWLPGWVPRPEEDRFRMTLDAIKAEAWVFEGGFSRTYPERLARADTVIWLDVPWPRRIWNVTRRLFDNYGQSRPDMQVGCEERIGWHSVEFYQYIWKTRHSNRARLYDLIQGVSEQKTVVVLNSFAAMNAYIEQVQT